MVGAVGLSALAFARPEKGVAKSSDKASIPHAGWEVDEGLGLEG